jgi:hypothetical protein
MNSVKQTPSEAVIRSADRKIARPFLESEGSLTCSQDPVTGTYPEPGESRHLIEAE